MNNDKLEELLDFANDISRDNAVYEIPTHARLHRLLAKGQAKEGEQPPSYDELLKSATSMCEQIVALVDIDDDERQMVLKTQSWIFHAALGYATSTSDKGWAYDHYCDSPWTIDEYFVQGYKQYKDQSRQSKTAYVTDVIKYVAKTKSPWLVFERDHSQTFSSHEHGGNIKFAEIIDIVTNVLFPVKGEVGLFRQFLNSLNAGKDKEGVKKLLEKNFEVKSKNNHTADFGFTPVQRAQGILKIGFIGLDSNERQSSWDFILGSLSSSSKEIFGGGLVAAFDTDDWKKHKDSVIQALDKFGDKAIAGTELA